uniref:Cation/H+ exchanger transmembrane domain-containing protein n=1 Tax=Noctiluca scintillans TaxID=2966 RepID=A0A7S1F7Y0_NOCSC|mmetsp:Transcript_3968/g.11050  ORF Transcript_3968/g.11050 Transcript_3968/m.11050 type:complete len:614 (+) Transcript_3968:74-1915(+)|eukprot:CAMPEP_0194524408 /NCGR_PEP_ID=MMETSP0253-20130528/59578_1 /TAXON_ID=2966 /ORGANISM="Noctiluca scintillans" /LENGTH=613 /DNA_ID=CAMNT_0039369033 /DNA_START=17 /DNA_END=1858 /DNA_ORIENTATION=+
MAPTHYIVCLIALSFYEPACAVFSKNVHIVKASELVSSQVAGPLTDDPKAWPHGTGIGNRVNDSSDVVETPGMVGRLKNSVMPPHLSDDLASILPGVDIHHLSSVTDEDTGYIVMIPSEHQLARHLIAPSALIFMLVFLIMVKIERWEISWIPESLLIIFLGIVAGYVFVYFGVTMEDDGARTKFMANLLNLVLLPIIIFETGWSLRVRDLNSQFVYIVIFAIVGTLINTGVVASLIYLTGHLGWHSITEFRTVLAFSSLISATDPVATLSTYSHLKVDPLLNIMVLGESVINDAVAIVLFKIFNSDAIMGTPGMPLPSGEEIVSRVCWSVTFNFVGSAVVGSVLGAIFVFVIRMVDMSHTPKIAALYVGVSGYAAFSMGEGFFGMSGIIVTLFCSTVMGVYARPHLKAHNGAAMTTYFVKQVASLADSSVFLLVGLAFVNIHGDGLRFAMSLIPICLLGRASSTFPLGVLVNGLKDLKIWAGRTRDANKLEGKHLFMMWHGGLRGAIALVLAMELGPWVDELDGEGTSAILHTATFMVIVVFLFVFGGTTQFFLNFFRIPVNVDAPSDYLSRKEEGYYVGESWLNCLLLGSKSFDSTPRRDIQEGLHHGGGH